MLKNSMRQMFRTPVRTVLFCILIGICTLLTTLGVNLFFISQKTQEEAEKAFVTIGTVRQKPSSVSMEEIWDPYERQYMSYAREKYDAPLPDSVLDVEGLPYIHKPRHQPFYMAYTGDYVVRTTNNEVDESWLGNEASSVIVEVQPFEDCVPDHPVKLHFKKVLYGNITERMLQYIWYWDMDNPNPEKLYADKTYIMSLYMDISVEYRGLVDKEKYPEVTTVWVPWFDMEGTQYTKDGKQIEDKKHKDVHYSEMAEDFYNTKEGKRWLNIVEGLGICNYSIPVIPTDSTSLLMYFYEGSAGVMEGRDITPEEYRSGKKVCLIEKEFAINNKLKTGDSLRLPLYYADYGWSASMAYPLGSGSAATEKLIDAEGNLYEPFEDSEYEIVGIYQVSGGEQGYTGFEAAKNGVIIPSDSVKNSDEENIISYRPMKEYNTVFQIENGTIDEFMDMWNQKGTDRLEITFRDNGYSELEQQFNNTRRMSVILLGAGVGTAILILLFFCHMFVTKQKLRIAIERSMGMTKRQCRASVLSGILLVILAGGIIGCTAGAVFTGETAKILNQKTRYSTMFSNNKVVEEERKSSEEILKENSMNAALPAATGAVFFIASWTIAGGMTEKILRQEPLKLLSEMKQEI